jgi:hypothetical protein
MSQQPQVVGPVQLNVIGFSAPEIPDELRRALENLPDQGAHLVDALVVRKDRSGNMERLTLDLTPETEPGPVSWLMTSVASRRMLSDRPPSGEYGGTTRGPGMLFSGDPIPNLRDIVPAGSSAVIVLIEHRWAIPVRDAILHSGASVLSSNAWLGFDDLQELGLLSPDVARQVAELRRY